MEKSILIGFTKEIAEGTQIKDVLGERESSASVLGRTQFRTMAEMCNNASAFEEIRFMVEYKMAKGNGWQKTINKDNERCGDVILRYLDKIKQEFDEENAGEEPAKEDDKEKELLHNISLFFGYLYWQATILIKEKEIAGNKQKSEYRKSNQGRKGGRY